MKKGFLFFILISLLLAGTVKADVGIGIRWSLEELSINHFQEKCLTYSIYNPFNSDVTASVSVSDVLEKYVYRIEPKQVFLPGYKGDPNDNAAKLANNKQVEVCFQGNIWGWPPFYPVVQEGGILAGSSPGNVVGVTGSSVSSVVHAPLTLHVGTMSNYYRFIIILTIVIVVLIVAVLKVMKKLPKRKKKYCSKCKKSYSIKTKFCSKCGKEL